MRFPLDILTSYLTEQGVEIIMEPAHPKDQFDWVTSVSDFLQSPANQIIVPVVDGSKQLTPLSPKIVAVRSYGDDALSNELKPDDLLVRTSLPVALLADRIQRFLFQIIQWNDKMTEMVDEGCISVELLRESEAMLGSYIGVSDAAFSYIAHTPNLPPIDEVSTYFVTNKNYPTPAIQATREAGLMKRWENQDWTVVLNKANPIIPHPTISRVIKRRGSYAAHILLVSQTRIDAAKRFLFDLLAAKIEACLRRHWRLENPLEQKYSYFLQEVFRGNTHDADRLAERAEIHDIPIEGAFEICVMSEVWKTGSAHYLSKRMLEAEPRCKVLVEDDEAIILLCAEKGQEDLIPQMEENVFQVALDTRVELGVSETVDRLAIADLALEEARTALRYGSLYSSRYLSFDDDDQLATTVFRLRRYFTYCALDQYENNSKFVSRILVEANPLQRLREADEKRGSADVEILRSYLYHEGRINVMSEKLHMHRNTVLYRLEKIREAISYDLNDSDVRQYLRTMYFLTT